MPSRSHRRIPVWRRRRLGLATGVVLVAGAIAVPAVNAATESTVTAKAGAKRLHDDFNGDGFADVAIGAPGTTVNTQERAGSVSVLYGSASGLATSRKQVLKGPGVKDPEGWRGLYGSQLESGDLDGDGYADLVSVIQDYKVDIDNGHTVQVDWGGPSGLSDQPTTIVWTPLKSATTGLFTVADVDGDQHPDVVTLTDDDWLSADPEKSNGDGTVFHGPFDREGHPAKKDYFTIAGRSQSYQSLTAGDVDGDGAADLAVRTTKADGSRGVELLLGGSGGFTRKGLLKDAQGRVVPGGDAAIGDLNKDGHGDIVIGHPAESTTGLPTKGGAVAVVYGGPNGLSTTRTPVWINQDTAGVPGAAEKGDGMGTGLSLGDTDGDGYLDVATGLPGEDLDTVADAGAVLVLRGGASGLTGTGGKAFTQSTANVPGTAETGDKFGAATVLVDADGDKKDGLVVGDPDENATDGSVWVFSTTSTGITATGSFSFGPTTMGFTASKARFGAAVSD